MSEYTLDDLNAARAELARWAERWADSTANNSNKHLGAIRAARARVRLIESELKRAGLLPLSEQEKLEAELDRRFPDARSKQIVEYQGRRYQRIFFPIERSRSGKSVSAWGSEWRLVSGE